MFIHAVPAAGMIRVPDGCGQPFDILVRRVRSSFDKLRWVGRRHEHGEEGMRGRPKAVLVLSEAEHAELTVLTLRRKTAQAVALRARIVLACAEGLENNTVVNGS
jgi:hypothetical protein